MNHVGGRDRRLSSGFSRASVLCLIMLSGCQPNPRSQIAAIADAALTEVKRTAPDQPLCVQRSIAPWQSAAAAHRRDPPAPPGFQELYGPAIFHGGGGLKGAMIGGITVRAGPACLDLRGPLVSGDHAMVEVHLSGVGLNVWLQRVDGDWRPVMTTTSVYG